MALVNGHTFAFCENTGVTAAEFGHILANPAAQINTSLGGNPDLTPEMADTYTTGLVFQPSFCRFRHVDRLLRHHDPEHDQSLSSNTIVNNCGLTGWRRCAAHPSRRGHRLLVVQQHRLRECGEVNIGTVLTKAVDARSHYSLRYRMPWASWRFNLAGTRVHQFLRYAAPAHQRSL